MILTILYVSFDHILAHFVANGTGKVSIFPEFPSPQFPFHFGISLKYCLCGFPLKPLHNSGYRIFRWESQEHIYLIFCHLQLFYHKLISHCDLFRAWGAGSLKSLLTIPLRYLGPTLCGTSCHIRHGLLVL